MKGVVNRFFDKAKGLDLDVLVGVFVFLMLHSFNQVEFPFMICYLTVNIGN
jgi:hypothetical protein